MFEGYFARRRLKTSLISIVISLIFLVLIYYHRGNIFSIHRSHLNRLKIRKEISFHSSFKKSTGNILSSIEFINSPYLNLESHYSNIIPIIVLSKATNIEIRDAIRRTWAFNRLFQNNTIEIKVFFLVGTDDYTMKRIWAEQMIFSDVIHVSIPDMNSFIAYKELSAMIWIRSYLPNVSFYIKTEDDVIINMKAIIDKLLPIINNVQNENLIIGWFSSEYSIQKEIYSKFITTVIPSTYIEFDYAINLLYIVTSKASDRMLDILNHIEFIEQPNNFFVTGILRDAAYVQIKNLAINIKDYQYKLSTGSCTDEFEKNTKLLLCSSSIFFGLRRSISEYFEAWNILHSQY